MNDDSKLGLLNIGSAADYLGISIDTLRRWEKKGRIKPLRSPGGHRYFSKADLDDLFGKRYTRDEETVRRSNEELGREPTTEPINTNVPLPTTAETYPTTQTVQTPPQEYSEIPKDQQTFPENQQSQGFQYNTPLSEEPLPATELLHPFEKIPQPVTPPLQPPQLAETVENSQKEEESKSENILVPAKDNNILTEEEIEKRINTIIKKEDKKNYSNIFLGIFAALLLLGNIFLIYIWFTTSRIVSPLP